MEPTVAQEDYLETILELIHQTGSARVRDIARHLNVAKSSVTSALRTLARQSLVDYKPYQLVRLTEQGRMVAEQVSHRHSTLSRFFTEVLNVEKHTAEANACRIEHVMGDEVLRRLSCFVDFMSNSSVAANNLPKAFGAHCQSRQQTGSCCICSIQPNNQPF